MGVIDLAALALGLALAQEPAAPAAPAPAEPAAAAEPAAPAGATSPAAAPAAPAKPKGADEVTKLLQKMPTMSEEEKQKAIETLMKQYGGAEANPVLPGVDTDLDKFLALPPKDQAGVVARGFMVDLIDGDAGRLVARAGLPFFIEGRRIDRPDDLKAEWSRTVRTRRTDLLTLYGVEVLAPADMEKKYGKAPQRLSNWSWRAPNTFVAVANVSGHATVLLLRQAGSTWQVVGYHD
jgi:hypothetical protein